MNDQPRPATIVVGVDGSVGSVEALREGARLATALGCSLRALTCWNYPNAYVMPYALGDFDFKTAAQKILDTAVESAFGLEWPENLTTQLIHGPPRETLIEASEDAAMLVLGRRGAGGFRGLLMGSVSSACSAHAHCPVLIVHVPRLGEDHV